MSDRDRFAGEDKDFDQDEVEAHGMQKPKSANMEAGGDDDDSVEAHGMQKPKSAAMEAGGDDDDSVEAHGMQKPKP
jgi:hypothetical protein